MKHRSGMRKAILLAGSSMLIALYTTGCNTVDTNPQVQAMNAFFPASGEVRDSQRVVRASAAAGARADATLQPYHFDKGELNSLGEQKLNLMLDDDDANNPIVIYMNLPADEFKSPRQDAVVAYLKSEGLETNQVSFKPAPNMNSGGLAQTGISRLAKTETGGTGGSGSKTEESSTPTSSDTSPGMTSK